MEKARCPECDRTIDHLSAKFYVRNYVTEFTHEHGTADLNGEDFECDDSDVDDSETTDSETEERHYYCPECDKEIDPDDLVYDEDDNNGQRSDQKPQPVQNEEPDLIERQNYYHSVNLVFFACSCGEQLEVICRDDKADEEIICFHCGRAVNKDTAKSIIKI